MNESSDEPLWRRFEAFKARDGVTTRSQWMVLIRTLADMSGSEAYRMIIPELRAMGYPNLKTVKLRDLLWIARRVELEDRKEREREVGRERGE
jgi:hypothetical protein